MECRKHKGAYEWAAMTYNIARGCEHNCRYCYARADAERRKQVAPGDWPYMVVNDGKARKGWRSYPAKQFMFPSTHDVTPAVLRPYMTALGNMLRAGHSALITTKPHLTCVRGICDEFGDFREQLTFRFTIGCRCNRLLRHWEPAAPRYTERVASLRHAFRRGFVTSVSCEPMLDSAHIIDHFHALEPFVNDTFWIGMMNDIERRVKVVTDEDRRQVERIKAGQTVERLREIHKALKDEPKVRWKSELLKKLDMFSDVASSEGGVR